MNEMKRLIVSLGFVLVVLGGKIKDERYGSRPCSLQTAATTAISCDFESTLDNSGNLVPLQLGETDCSVELKGCIPGECYLIADMTHSSYKPDNSVQHPLPSSVFSNINISSGSFLWSQKGLEFIPKESDVVLSYSTANCALFYSYRGKVTIQDCSAQINSAISRPTPTHGPFTCSILT